MKLKVVFNSETHLITRVPDSLAAFCKTLPTIFLSELPSEWGLIYTDSEGRKILISDDISFQEFKEVNKNKTAKVYILPKPIEGLQDSNICNSRKTSENLEQEESVLTESVALSTLLVPAERAEKIVIAKEEEADMALSSFRSLNSEQALQEMIAKAVEKQVAKITMVTAPPTNEKSIMEKIEELKKLVHQDVRCDGCGMLPIEGIRYKCAVCDSFDFCNACEATKEHPHALIKIKWSGQEYTKPVKEEQLKSKPSPKKFKAPVFNSSFKLPTFNQAPIDSEIEAKFRELKHMALLKEIKAVAPTFGASNRLRVSETVNIKKPSEQNKLWGGQEKVNVEELRLSEPQENTQGKKQVQVREEVDMSLFDDFLKWRQQRREDIVVQKDLMKEVASKPIVKMNYQSDSELDSSSVVAQLLSEIRSKGTQRKSRRYEEESSELDAQKAQSKKTVGFSDLLAEIRAKGCLRKNHLYKSEINDLKNLEMNMLNQLCKIASPKKSPKKVQFRDSGSDTDVSQLLAEIREVGQKKQLLAEIRAIGKQRESVERRSNDKPGNLLAEIRAKGKQRKSCEYREEEHDSRSRHTIELNQMNLFEANRRAHEEFLARKYEGLDDSMHDLLEEIRAAKGTVKKEKKKVEKEYSESVRAKAALIQEVLSNLSMKDILEFVANAPEDLDAEELLANYEL